MREDYDEIGHYVRSLSRILLLIAVIIAVPLILSTITAFVRNQSNVSTFHDLLATASVNGLGRTTIAEPKKKSLHRGRRNGPIRRRRKPRRERRRRCPLTIRRTRHRPHGAWRR